MRAHHNPLPSQRKRLGLSQGEVAFLMGTHGGAGISRYEKHLQKPGIETALALEIILGRPASELFAGLREKVRKKIQARAKILLYKTINSKSTRQRKRKRRTLLALLQKEIYLK